MFVQSITQADATCRCTLYEHYIAHITLDPDTTAPLPTTMRTRTRHGGLCDTDTRGLALPDNLFARH